MSLQTVVAYILNGREERIIRRAARAEHDYNRLVAGSDDQRRRLAMIQRRVELNAELRGDPVSLPSRDLSISLDVAVKRELAILEPKVRTELQLQRQTKRIGMSCGPVQLMLARRPTARRKLMAVLQSCKLVARLSTREIAAAIGVTERTLERHVAGEKMSAERQEWYDRLETIDVEGDFYHILVRRVASTRKKWGWNLTRDERRALLVPAADRERKTPCSAAASA